MEITLELENSDLVIDFEPEFLCGNVSDQTKVQWQFHDRRNSYPLADVFNRITNAEDSGSDLLPNL